MQQEVLLSLYQWQNINKNNTVLLSEAISWQQIQLKLRYSTLALPIALQDLPGLCAYRQSSRKGVTSHGNWSSLECLLEIIDPYLLPSTRKTLMNCSKCRQQRQSGTESLAQWEGEEEGLFWRDLTAAFHCLQGGEDSKAKIFTEAHCGTLRDNNPQLKQDVSIR